MICAKCGINSKDDSSLTFHRFPLPSVRDSLKAKVWAKFCFPDEDWTSDQSLRSLYKQHKMLCADRLAIIIKEVLNTCFTCGLIVIGTVCDCDLVNLRALNLLGSTKMKPFFDYDGHEIVTVLDPPHLLKCFRNNFMKHNVVFPEDIQIDGQQKTGW
ncbi:unnamed protein product, partial [Iphiclides podalirius]